MGRPQFEHLFGNWRLGNWHVNPKHVNPTVGLAATLLLHLVTLPATAQLPTAQTSLEADAQAYTQGSNQEAAQRAAQATAQRTAHFELNKAICNNDWNRAVNITSQLVAHDATTNEGRLALLSLRRQLDQLRAQNTILGRTQACDDTDPYVLAADPLAVGDAELGPEPLGWEGAVAEAASPFYGTPQLVTESVELTLPVSMSTRPGLLNAQPIDLSKGLSVVAGHVGEGHQVYGFVAAMGDRLNINLEVTDVMPGTLYTSDDSQLFVFDRDGRLLAASDDDGTGAQSYINGMVAPRTDAYFAVVTSYNNDPIFDQENRLMGWHDNGGGRFDYTLSVAGATPTGQLMR